MPDYLNSMLIAGLRRRSAEPHTQTRIVKRRKPMSWFSHGYHGKRHCSWARTHDDDDDDDDGVAQHGGNTPNNRLQETYSLDLPCTSLILDIHAMMNLHLSKQSIRWPVSRGHIAGSSLELIKVTCFLKLTADHVLVFWLDHGLMSGWLVQNRVGLLWSWIKD